ncbi:MAG: ribonuclease III [Bacteroidetes bacterium]|nr:ribonuclease III [Bacteroidota bacterium]MCL5737961.1 ribonuclease III [Bacteroidota bacterium]
MISFSPKKFFQTRIFKRGDRSRKLSGSGGARLKKKRELEQILGIKIKNEDYFVEALTHRSALSLPSSDKKRSNERLEYLGDAVLNLLVAEILFDEYPELDEGQMTRFRSLLVNQRALAECAGKISLSYFITMSTSAQQAIEKGYETIISDAFEAVIAAIYLDGGIKAAKTFVRREVMLKQLQIDKELFKALDRNFKSALLELSQSRGLGAPRYNLIKEEGPDHDRTFTVEVIIGETRHGAGSGKTKKAAEQAAAEQAYESLKPEPPVPGEDQSESVV